MRILSQDGKIDMPYEMVALEIKYLGVFGDGKERFGIHYSNKNMFVVDTIIAIYSTEDKARKAMEMLQKAYSPLLIIKDLGDGIEADIKPNDWQIQRTEPNGIRENYYFRFPDDAEVEA